MNVTPNKVPGWSMKEIIVMLRLTIRYAKKMWRLRANCLAPGNIVPRCSFTSFCLSWPEGLPLGIRLFRGDCYSCRSQKYHHTLRLQPNNLSKFATGSLQETNTYRKSPRVCASPGRFPPVFPKSGPPPYEF